MKVLANTKYIFDLIEKYIGVLLAKIIRIL